VTVVEIKVATFTGELARPLSLDIEFPDFTDEHEKPHTALQQDDTSHFHTHVQQIFSGNFTG
jgi:hypothetical protein